MLYAWVIFMYSSIMCSSRIIRNPKAKDIKPP